MDSLQEGMTALVYPAVYERLNLGASIWRTLVVAWQKCGGRVGGRCYVRPGQDAFEYLASASADVLRRNIKSLARWGLIKIVATARGLLEIEAVEPGAAVENFYKLKLVGNLKTDPQMEFDFLYQESDKLSESLSSELSDKLSESAAALYSIDSTEQYRPYDGGECFSAGSRPTSEQHAVQEVIPRAGPQTLTPALSPREREECKTGPALMGCENVQQGSPTRLRPAAHGEAAERAGQPREQERKTLGGRSVASPATQTKNTDDAMSIGSVIATRYGPDPVTADAGFQQASYERILNQFCGLCVRLGCAEKVFRETKMGIARAFHMGLLTMGQWEELEKWMLKQQGMRRRMAKPIDSVEACKMVLGFVQKRVSAEHWLLICANKLAG